MGLQDKRFCIVIGQIGIGGAERFAVNLANHLDEQGANICLITFAESEHKYQVNSTVYVYTPNKLNRIKGKTFKAIYRGIYIRNKLRSLKPDFILCILSPSYFMAITWGIGLKNVFISIRNDPRRFEFYDSAILRKVLFRKATGVFAQTAYAKYILYRQTEHENIYVIPNFIRKLKVYNVKRSKAIISVGRLIESKGFNDLLEIFAMAQTSGWNLIILGDGPLKDRLRNKAIELGISERVEFKGFVENVDYYLQKAEIFAYCSKSEGFPNALLEAMATPLACISYDCVAGPSEIIEHNKNGFLIGLNDKETFTNYLDSLISSSELRDRLRNEAIKVRHKYSMELIANKYLEVFDNHNV